MGPARSIQFSSTFLVFLSSNPFIQESDFYQAAFNNDDDEGEDPLLGSSGSRVILERYKQISELRGYDFTGEEYASSFTDLYKGRFPTPPVIDIEAEEDDATEEESEDEEMPDAGPTE